MGSEMCIRDSYFNGLIAPARGSTSSILQAFGRQPKPQILYWSRIGIQHLSGTVLREIASLAVREQQALRAVSRSFASAIPSRKKANKAKKKRQS